MTDRPPRIGQTAPGYGPLPQGGAVPSPKIEVDRAPRPAAQPIPPVGAGQPDFAPVSAPLRDPAAPPREHPKVVMPSIPDKYKSKGPPAVDIDLVYERRTAPLPDQAWIFLEVWTRNTIYQLDAGLHCIDVVDQGTRRSVPDHPLRGSRLVGGQSRDGDAMELSHPFPRPGSEAVFEQSTGKHVRFSQTSTVTRVVMRLRVLTVEPEQLLPTWEDMSGRWEAQSTPSAGGRGSAAAPGKTKNEEAK